MAEVHAALDPVWVLARDRRRHQGGGGYEPRCRCGWHGSLERTVDLARARAKRHAAREIDIQPVA